MFRGYAPILSWFWLIATLGALVQTAPAQQRPASPFPVATPESVGLSKKTLQALADRVRELGEDGDMVGAELLVVKNRKTVLHQAFGWKDAEDKEPMQPGTIFCIRSMTKPLVGAAVQILIDEGKLTLSDRASTYLPSFDNDRSRDITIEQLLTHTAGFPISLMNRPHTAYSGLREVADQAGTTGPSLKPGTYSYSDADTETLAAIVTVVAGQSVEQFIQKRILDPLGMTDTYLVLGKDAPARPRVASDYAGSPTLWHKYWDNDSPPFFPYFLGAAAGYSTTTDYARFLTLWMDHGKVGQNRILSESAVDRVLRPAVAMTSPTGGDYPTSLSGFHVFYGQHMMVFDNGTAPEKGHLPAFGHNGSDGTFAWAFPDQDLLVLYFTQSRGGLSGFDVEAAINPLLGLPAPPPPNRVPTGKFETAGYAGCYRSESTPDSYLFVDVRGQRLTVAFPGSPVSALRWPNASGTWAFAIQPQSACSFEFDQKGKVAAVKISATGYEQTFRRVEKPADAPTVDELMKLRREGQGGARIDKIKSLQMTGTIQIGGQQRGQVSQTAVGVDYFLQELVSATDKDVTLVTPELVSRKAMGSPNTEPLSGILIEEQVQKSPLVRLGDWRDEFASIDIIRKDRIGDEDVWVVRLGGGASPPTVRYVSAKTGLLLKEESWLTIKGLATFPRTNKFEEYRQVDGVWFPFRFVTNSAVTGEQSIAYSAIVANPAKLPASLEEHLHPAKK